MKKEVPQKKLGNDLNSNVRIDIVIGTYTPEINGRVNYTFTNPYGNFQREEIGKISAKNDKFKVTPF